MPWNSSDFRLVFSKFKIIFKRNKDLVGMHPFNPFIQQKWTQDKFIQNKARQNEVNLRV